MKRTSFSLLWFLSILGIVLVPAVTLMYSYDALTLIESSAGLLIMIAVAGFLWVNQRRLDPADHTSFLDGAIWVGIGLGVLWLIEISINNLVAPPLPARDIIDNIFWAVIALSILGYSFFCGYRTGSGLQGIKAGLWSGFASGLVACCTALAMVVFAMRFILQDPLNISEWAARGSASGAPSMAAYFAYETFAGAFLHLVGLGLIMGGLLGVLGGPFGRVAKGWVEKTSARGRPSTNEETNTDYPVACIRLFVSSFVDSPLLSHPVDLPQNNFRRA